MKHDEYIRCTGSKEAAVLMIHGIAGSPAHFECLMRAVPDRLSVFNILLDGHNGEVEDFSHTSMKKWKAQVRAVLDGLLSEYEKVFIVAHSMGTLFALQAAIDHPDRIPGLFLLSPPLRPWVRVSTVLTALRVGLGWFSPDDEKANAMFNDTGIRLTRKLWKYIGWTPRMIELISECRRVRKMLHAMKVPAQAYHARQDELVSLRTIRDMENHRYIKNEILASSGHFAYSPEDAEILRRALAAMMEASGP